MPPCNTRPCLPADAGLVASLSLFWPVFCFSSHRCSCTLSSTDPVWLPEPAAVRSWELGASKRGMPPAPAPGAAPALPVLSLERVS